MNSKERQINHVQFSSPDAGDSLLRFRSSGRAIFGSNRRFFVLCHFEKEPIVGLNRRYVQVSVEADHRQFKHKREATLYKGDRRQHCLLERTWGFAEVHVGAHLDFYQDHHLCVS